MSTRFALVDCNNFYASCEQLFDPKLSGRAVVVLSNNDGCVVARSAQARAVGVPMGAPWFKLQDLAREHHIIARSSNYALYADMSDRVVEILRRYTPDLEIYSIDESFLGLSGFLHRDLTRYGQRMRAHIARWLGLPVCVGIARTKTRAKLANHIAKKWPGFDGVCDLEALAPARQRELFERIDVSEVWGVGRKITEQLNQRRITTVQQLMNADPTALRRQFSVVLERTARELNGLSCLPLEDVAPAKQQIMSSRSFGTLVMCLDELREAVTSYTARAAEKLRAQQHLAGALVVFIHTNPFKPEVPQYHRSRTLAMPSPTSDTRVLCETASALLKAIYRSGYAYHKAGVMLSDLRPQAQQQGELFSTNRDSANRHPEALMAAMDAINRKWGRNTIGPSVNGRERAWQMRRDWLSPAYTTDWAGVPKVN